MANGHGGARPGAGRPRKVDKHAGQIAALEQQIADSLPERFAALDQLARGGYDQVAESWKPAGSVTIGSGEQLQFVYPQLPPDQMVLVERRVSVAAPDRKANEYLIDRILGRPTARLEADLDLDGSLALTAPVLDAAARELAAWRQQMSAQLSTPNAPPTPPISATPT